MQVQRSNRSATLPPQADRTEWSPTRSLIIQGINKIARPRSVRPISGADPGFFLGGGALVSCSTSTPIKHIVFFCRIPVVLENRRSSQGGGGCAPPAPSPSIRPWICLIKSMIIDRTGRLEVLLPLNHNHYNFRENKCILLFLLIPTIQIWENNIGRDTA